MAVWQFSMYLVPRSQLVTVCPDLTSPVTGYVFDHTHWWCDSQPAENLAERLSGVLDEVRSWRSESRQWGPDSTNTVAVHYAVGRVEEIHARLDLRELDDALVKTLAALAADSDGWWLGDDAEMRLPVGETREAIIEAARASHAAQFVADPRTFLGSIDSKRWGT
jgi:hypothetical protein